VHFSHGSSEQRRDEFAISRAISIAVSALAVVPHADLSRTLILAQLINIGLSTRFMFSRLSRYLTRPRRRKTKYKPVPDFPPKLTLNIPSSAETRPSSASSGHSSSCSIQPDHAPSFLQVVCNDSQPVYCMETVPFYNSSSLPPGTRKANSLYESAHDEILKARMRVTALETEAEGIREQRERSMEVDGNDRPSFRIERKPPVGRCSSLQHSDMERIETQRCNSLHHSTREWRYGRQPWEYREREREAMQYTSGDQYFGPPIYRDNSRSRHSTRLQRSQKAERGIDDDRQYVEREPRLRYPQDYPPPPPKVGRLIHPGPFRQRLPPSPTEQFPLPPETQSRTLPADLFIRQSSLRQGPYQNFQLPQSSQYHANTHDPRLQFRENVPMTRVTRLKRGKTFIREDGIVTDVGIGLGRISGMAASRSASRRTQSDVGVGTRTPISKPSRKVISLVHFCLLLSHY